MSFLTNVSAAMGILMGILLELTIAVLEIAFAAIAMLRAVSRDARSSTLNVMIYWAKILGISLRGYGEVLKTKRIKAAVPVAKREPPTIAEFLVSLFAKKRYRGHLLVCLEEDFRADLAAGMSLSRAKRRYWAAALNSIGPQLWAAIKRLGLLGAAFDYIRGKLG